MANFPEYIEPPWLRDLENQLQYRKQCLGHEVGAGSKCIKCKNKCTGLVLHYWRKMCMSCKCRKEDHDITDESSIRHEILFKIAGSKTSRIAQPALAINALGNTAKNAIIDQFADYIQDNQQVQFDWLPAQTSDALAANYLEELPPNKIPISCSEGAKYRKQQLQKQIPIHDFLLKKSSTSLEEENKFFKYVENLRRNGGTGKILKVQQRCYVEKSLPCNIQAPQSSQDMKRQVTVEDQDLENAQNNTFDRMLGSDGLSTINTTQRLPQTIPTSALPLPSSFIPKKIGSTDHNQDTVNGGSQSLNNNWKPMNTWAKKKEFGFPNKPEINPLPEIPTEKLGNEIMCSSVPPVSPGTSTSMSNDDYPAHSSNHSNQVKTLSHMPHQNVYGGSPPNSNVIGTLVDNESSDCTLPISCADISTGVLEVEGSLRCHNCKDVINVNSIAVLTEKTGLNVAWHPKCFVCTVCQELLVDLTYFHHKGSVFCGRHFAEIMKIQRCSACDELIFAKTYTYAEGQFYHVQHFCCTQCDTELAGKEYLMDENHPTCIPCYDEKYPKNCETCQRPIGACIDSFKFDDLYWHMTPDCFKCNFIDCGRSLVNVKLMIKHKKPFCSKACASAAI